MQVSIKRIKPYPQQWYDVYFNGKRLKDGKEYSLPPNGVFQLIQRNVLDSKLWLLYLVLNLVVGFFSGVIDNYSDVSKKQKVIDLNYTEMTGDMLSFTIYADISKIDVNGANCSWGNSYEIIDHKMVKRLRIAKVITFGILAAMLIAVTTIVIVAIVSK